MTADELDAFEARHQPRGNYTVCQTCEALWPCASARTATALREAWAEVEHWKEQHLAGDTPFLRDRAEKAEAAIARVRERHTSIPLTDPCDHEDRDACDAFETSDGEWVCGPVVAHACAECRDESGELVDYPCDTIRDLDGEA